MLPPDSNANSEQHSDQDVIRCPTAAVLTWANANNTQLIHDFDKKVADSTDVELAVSTFFNEKIPTNTLTQDDKDQFKLFLI